MTEKLKEILSQAELDKQAEKLIAERLSSEKFLKSAEEVCHKIFDGDSPSEDSGIWLNENEEKSLVYSAAMLLRLLWLKDFIAERGMPEKHFTFALKLFKNISDRSYNKFGFYGLNESYRAFCYSTLKPKRFRVGRLTFEMGTHSGNYEVYEVEGQYIPVALAGERFSDGLPVKKDFAGEVFVTDCEETADGVIGYTYDDDGRLIYEKKRFKGKKVLKNGDNVLHVHISSEGKLSDEDVKESFNEAPGFFEKYYPDFQFKAFICSSWLLDTGLKNVLKPDSNILKFQKNFRIAIASVNGFALYWNIFGIEKFLPLDELEPSNGFQRRTLDYIKAGNNLYSGKGFIMK